MEGEWKHTGCNICGIRCGLECLVKDNEIIDVRPSTNEVSKTPYCCRKGRSTKYFQHHPDRLNYPLKKVNGEFVRISWEQAYSEIGSKLKKILDKYGPRTFAFACMGTAADQSDAATLMGSLQAIGGQYIYSPIGMEFASNWWAHGRIVGHQGMVTESDEDNIDTFIFWGSNAYVSHQIVQARKVIRRFAEDLDKRVIVVDPRLSETARMADMHIQVKPGLDAIMIRGLIALILDKGWEDKEYLEKYTTGWEKAINWYKDFDYQEAFDLAGVPLEQMEEFCRILTTTTWGVHQDLGLFFGRHSTLDSYLLYELMAVTGNLEIKGNKTMDSFARFAQTKYDETNHPNMWRTVETDLFPVVDQYPTTVLSDEILSPKENHLRAMITVKGNPARSYPDVNRMAKALDSLDLLVSIDIVMTETARHADYVLPGMTGFEEYHWGMFQGNPQIVSSFLKKPILKPVGERQSGQNIIMNILRAAGYVPEMPDKIYRAAERSVRERDIVIFMKSFMPWMMTHPKYKNSMTLLFGDALSRYMDNSVSCAMLRAVLSISHLPSLGYPQRAGYQPKKKYRWMLKTPLKAFAYMSMMDNVFWELFDSENGAIVGRPDPDIHKQMKNVILHDDGKIHLFDETVDKFMKELTVEKEREATAPTAEFPDLVSSGVHMDDGVNTLMRNNDTYKYRKPFKLYMNPVEAKRRGFKEDDIIRVTSKAGHIDIPLEYSWKMADGYSMFPHHSGLKNESQPLYGQPANVITSHQDYDEIGHNSILRFVKCRFEKVGEVQPQQS